MEYLKKQTQHTPRALRSSANRTSEERHADFEKRRLSQFRDYNTNHRVSPLALRLIATRPEDSSTEVARSVEISSRDEP